MPLRIATWNVNSVRQREAHLQRLVAEQQPDVICLQEIKCENGHFPGESLEALGFAHRLIHGQKSYNGVAILSRVPFAEEGKLVWCRKDDCRHAWVRLDGERGGGLEVHNFYVPAGGDKPDPAVNPKFKHKLSFLRAMARWCRQEQVAERKVVLVGDLNVAPLETDVWNHKRLVRNVGHTPVESGLMKSLQKAGGLIDLPRRFVPPDQPLYTWWGYRFPQSVEKDYGWRLDHVLASEAVARETSDARVVRDTRLWERPSDHVPVVMDIG